MSIGVIGVLGIVLLLVVILARMPIGLALAAVGFLGYAAADSWSNALTMVGNVPFDLARAY